MAGAPASDVRAACFGSLEAAEAALAPKRLEGRKGGNKENSFHFSRDKKNTQNMSAGKLIYFHYAVLLCLLCLAAFCPFLIFIFLATAFCLRNNNGKIHFARHFSILRFSLLLLLSSCLLFPGCALGVACLSLLIVLREGVSYPADLTRLKVSLPLRKNNQRADSSQPPRLLNRRSQKQKQFLILRLDIKFPHLCI
jgi:hypothetical protein